MRDVRPSRLSSEGATDYRRGWSEAKSPVTIPPKLNHDGVTELNTTLAVWRNMCYFIHE